MGHGQRTGQHGSPRGPRRELAGPYLVGDGLRARRGRGRQGGGGPGLRPGDVLRHARDHTVLRLRVDSLPARDLPVLLEPLHGQGQRAIRRALLPGDLAEHDFRWGLVQRAPGDAGLSRAGGQGVVRPVLRDAGQHGRHAGQRDANPGDVQRQGLHQGGQRVRDGHARHEEGHQPVGQGLQAQPGVLVRPGQIPRPDFRVCRLQRDGRHGQGEPFVLQLQRQRVQRLLRREPREHRLGCGGRLHLLRWRLPDALPEGLHRAGRIHTHTRGAEIQGHREPGQAELHCPKHRRDPVPETPRRVQRVCSTGGTDLHGGARLPGGQHRPGDLHAEHPRAVSRPTPRVVHGRRDGREHDRLAHQRGALRGYLEA